MTRTSHLLGVLVTLLVAGAARADTYYVIVFGAESRPQRPKYSHSWATFVRFPGGDPCGPPTFDAGPPEIVTISWLPGEIELHPNRLLPEEGRNFDLPTTLHIVLAQCEHVMAWGPYQITPELFCRAKKQVCKLQSGAARYKTIDFGYKPFRARNCIHALTEINPENIRLRVGRLNFGDVASYYITDGYRDWIICPNQVHCWVTDLLGLGQYPIRWRTLQQGVPRGRDS